MRKAVFLDRDGTLNSDEGHYYIYKTSDFILNKGVVEGLKLLQDNGFLLIVITNQGGVAKGIYTEQDVCKVHKYMCELLAKSGIEITATYYCPHHESISPCDCRKPSPFMIEKAIKDFGLDKTACCLIGDSLRDVVAGQEAGIKVFQIEKNTSIFPVCKKIVNHED